MEHFDVVVEYKGEKLNYSADVYENGSVRVRGHSESYRWKCRAGTYAAKDTIQARLVDDNGEVVSQQLDQSLAQPGQKVQIFDDSRWLYAGRITEVLSEARKSEELEDSH